MSKSAKQSKQNGHSVTTSTKKKTASFGTANKGKGRKVRDRAEVEKMNGMGSLGELQGRLSGRKIALPVSQNKVNQISRTPATTAELANSLAKTL